MQLLTLTALLASLALLPSTLALPQPAAPSPSSTTTASAPLNTSASVFAASKAALGFEDRAAAILAAGGPQQFVYDFNPGLVNGSTTGGVSLLQGSSFPAAINSGASMLFVTLPACGLAPPHFHRATEIITPIDGPITTQFIINDGIAPVSLNLTKLQATIYYPNSLHYQFNPSCNPVTYVSALSGDDAGITSAIDLFQLDPAIVDLQLGMPQAIGGKDIQDFAKSLPVGILRGVQACLSSCGIQGS